MYIVHCTQYTIHRTGRNWRLSVNGVAASTAAAAVAIVVVVAIDAVAVYGHSLGLGLFERKRQCCIRASHVVTVLFTHAASSMLLIVTIALYCNDDVYRSDHVITQTLAPVFDFNVLRLSFTSNLALHVSRNFSDVNREHVFIASSLSLEIFGMLRVKPNVVEMK